MFLIVDGNRVYGENLNDLEVYPLVSITINSDNGVTVTDEGEGVATLPTQYYRASLEEVIAMFGITPTAGYKPPATITGNAPVTIYADEANKEVTLAVATPTRGDSASVASSDPEIATVTEADGVFTIVPGAVGVCNVTGTWTPTNTDFAATVVTIPVTISKRQIEFDPIRDQSLTKAIDKTIILKPNVGSGSVLSYTVLSSDTGICSPAITGTAGNENDLVLTVADTTPLGVAVISVFATDTNAKAADSEVMTFKVRVCNSAVTITEIADTIVEAGKDKTITATCAGAKIVEAVSSDPTAVTVEIVDTLKFKVTAVGAAASSATITIYCDKRGYGEDSEEVGVTVS